MCVGFNGDFVFVAAPVNVATIFVLDVVVCLAIVNVGSFNGESVLCVGINGDVAFTPAPVRVATISALVVVPEATVKVGAAVSLSWDFASSVGCGFPLWAGLNGDVAFPTVPV